MSTEKTFFANLLRHYGVSLEEPCYWVLEGNTAEAGARASIEVEEGVLLAELQQWDAGGVEPTLALTLSESDEVLSIDGVDPEGPDQLTEFFLQFDAAVAGMKRVFERR